MKALQSKHVLTVAAVAIALRFIVGGVIGDALQYLAVILVPVGLIMALGGKKRHEESR